MAAGHGGQVLLSESTRTLLDDRFEVRDLGEHRLKDLSGPAAPLPAADRGAARASFRRSRRSTTGRRTCRAQPNAFIGRTRELEGARGTPGPRRRPAPDAYRRRRDRQDAARAPGRGGRARAVSQRRLLRLARAGPRLGAGRARRSHRRSGCGSSPARRSLETLTEYLRDKEMLLRARQPRAGAARRRR